MYSRYLFPFWYGYFDRQCWAMLTLLVIHTWPAGFDEMYSTNLFSAWKRPGFPMMRQ